MCGESDVPPVTDESEDGESLFGSQVEAYAQEVDLEDDDIGEVLSLGFA